MRKAFQGAVMLLLLTFTLFVAATTAFAVPACPEPAAFKQPNEAVIQVHIKGDEFLSWTEDANGSLILFDEVKNGYCHAFWTDAGPVSTGELVTAGGQGVALFGYAPRREKGADIPQAVIDNALELREKYAPDIEPAQLEASLSPATSGAPEIAGISAVQRNLLIIYVRWANEADIPASPLTGQAIHDLVFNPDTLSVNAYYKEMFGKTEDVVVPAQVGNPLDGWQGIIQVTLPGQHANPQKDTDKRAALINRALGAAAPYIDFSAFDTNGNGVIETSELSIGMIIHGYEASFGSSPPPSFWGSAYSNMSNYYNGVRVSSAFAQGAYQGDKPLTIGVICHEFAHSAYGLVDTYDRSDKSDRSNGQGFWSLMAQGSWGRKSSGSNHRPGSSPAYIDAYNLVKYNLVTPGVIFVEDEAEDVRLNTATDIYKITNNADTRQYFLTQQRVFGAADNFDRGAFYGIGAMSADSGGMLIYHVDESVGSAQNDNPARYLAAVVEAHGGTQHLRAGENNGDYGDLWGNGKNTIMYTTDPSSNLYAPDGTQSLRAGVILSGIKWDSGMQATTFNVYNDGIDTRRSIESFSFPGLADAIEIEHNNGAIVLTVPAGTDLTSLTPEIVFLGVSVTPASGVAQDFTKPIQYTVRAVNGSTRRYTVFVLKKAPNVSRGFIAPIDAPDPYAIPISTPEELYSIRNNLSGSYVLVNDIDLSGWEWEPIGSAMFETAAIGSIRDWSNAFSGVFDGQGYEIHNMTITDSRQVFGLFGICQNAIFKNVGLKGVRLDSYYSDDVLSSFWGSLVGYARYCSIQNCYSAGDISLITSDRGTYVGGLLGYCPVSSSSTPIRDCHNSVNIISKINKEGAASQRFVGGIVSYGGSNIHTASIVNCYNKGVIICLTNRSYDVGGIWGDGFTNAENCYNFGDIFSGYGALGVVSRNGGICGHLRDGKISHSFNTGNVYAVGNGDPVGGILGSSMYSPIVVNCYNMGDVYQMSPLYTGGTQSGGIIGRSYSGTISNCYNAGSVFAAAPNYPYVGGIAGFGGGSTTNSSISACVVLADEIRATTGGSNYYSYLIAQNGIKINNYALQGILGNATNDANRRITLAEARDKSTYDSSTEESLGWDFDTIWDIDPAINNGFPFFKNAPPVPLPGTRTVTFRPSGGAGVMPPDEVDYGQPYTIPPCAFTLEGFAFVGWATVSGGPVVYADGDTTPPVEYNLTLYAVWSRIVCTVAFDANGGAGVMPQGSVNYGAAYTLPPNAFVRANHTFGGWALTRGGPAVYADGAVVPEVAADLTLYAVWNLTNITFVSLTANGAANTVTTTELTLTFSDAVPGLSITDITVIGATKGALSGSGPVYTLTVSDIAAEGDVVTVSVASPEGYTITPAQLSTVVHKEAEPGTPGTLIINVKSLIVKLGKTMQIPYSWDGASPLVFSSTNASICGVTQDGLLVPMKAGTTAIMIKLSDGSLIYSLSVTVTL